jgi:hypothetical protein
LPGNGLNKEEDERKMSNHCHNTITITGEAAELRKFAAKYPPESDACIRSLGWDSSLETIEIECPKGNPVHALRLVYHTTTSWGPPVATLELLSLAYPELRFELENSFLPGEGVWGHLVFRAGKYQGRCPDGWGEDMRPLPCPDNENNRNLAEVVYGLWWQYCEKHKTRWCMGDADCWGEGAPKNDPAEEERVFHLLGGGEGVPEESGHGWLSYAPDSYRDVDQADRRFWRATVIYRDRRRAFEAEAAAAGLTVEQLRERRHEEMNARMRAEFCWNALMYSHRDDEIPF